MPGDPDAHKEASMAWRKSQVFARGLLQEADLLPTKGMLLVEDLSDDALPSTTDVSTHINPPEKVQQIGFHAGSCLLSGYLAKPEEGERHAQVVIDLSVHTCDLSRAFLTDLAAKTLPTSAYYFGFCVSEVHLEWTQKILSQFLADGYLNSEIALPHGVALPPVDLPADQLQVAPQAPSLTSLVVNNKVKVDQLPTLKCPDRILASWHDHSRFGSEFRTWLEKNREEGLIDVPPEKADPDTTNPRKRGGPGGGSQAQPKAKAAKVEAAAEAIATIDVSALPTPLKWEASLPGGGRGKPGPALVLTIGERAFVCNRTTQEQVLPAGTALAGFYKGLLVASQTERRRTAAERRKRCPVLPVRLHCCGADWGWCAIPWATGHGKAKNNASLQSGIS